MTDNQLSATKEVMLQELLAAVKANTPVAGGWGPCSAERSFDGDWLVMDRDCTERVKRAAAALRQLAVRDSAVLQAIAGTSAAASKEQEDRKARELLVEELLTAIEANKPIATGTGRCPAVPCFDRHDREAESQRPGWEVVVEACARRIEKAAAALEKDLGRPL